MAHSLRQAAMGSHRLHNRGLMAGVQYVKYASSSNTSSKTSCPFSLIIFCRMGKQTSSSWATRAGCWLTLSSTVHMVRMVLNAASPSSPPSAASSASRARQKAAARCCVRPRAKGAISSSNFSTIASRVSTRSSLSTSCMSLNISSRREGMRGLIWSTSSVSYASMNCLAAITAPTRTGRSGSARRATLALNSAWKVGPDPCPAANLVSENTPPSQHALARRWPWEDANSGTTCAASIPSNCPLYAALDLRMSDSAPMERRAPSILRATSSGTCPAAAAC
mmetsp:Transcript_10773/g.32326  ORF Transcript_10773/g.32326 Transcript_10773/m.32326 type:complete len:280 (-) Transcript_10773:1449-2288(-)